MTSVSPAMTKRKHGNGSTRARYVNDVRPVSNRRVFSLPWLVVKHGSLPVLRDQSRPAELSAGAYVIRGYQVMAKSIIIFNKDKTRLGCLLVQARTSWTPGWMKAWSPETAISQLVLVRVRVVWGFGVFLIECFSVIGTKHDRFLVSLKIKFLSSGCSIKKLKTTPLVTLQHLRTQYCLKQTPQVC